MAKSNATDLDQSIIVGATSTGEVRRILVDSTGALQVTGGGGGGGAAANIGSNGGAVPTSSALIAGNNAGVLRPLSVDASGNLTVSPGNKAPDAVVPGTNNLGVLPAIATTAAPSFTDGRQVGLSTDLAGNLRVNVTNSPTNPSIAVVSAAPPASAQFIGARVLAASPAYTTATMEAPTLTLAGALRTDATATTQPVAGTASDNSTNSTLKLPVIPAVATTAAPTLTNGNQAALSMDLSGNLRVTNIIRDPAVYTGNLTAINQSVITTPSGLDNGLAIQISGTFVGTVTFEGSLDGTNYSAIPTRPLNGGAPTSTATAPGIFKSSFSGIRFFRVRCSAFTSGTIVVTVDAQSNNGAVSLSEALPVGQNNIGSIFVQAGQLGLTTSTGTIATANTSVVAAATNASRRYLLVQNVSATEIYVNFSAVAVNPTAGFRLGSNESWEAPSHAVPTTTVNIVGATVGQRFIVMQG